MAKVITGSVRLKTHKTKRKGVHAKRGSSKNKNAFLYKKPNRGQGR